MHFFKPLALALLSVVSVIGCNPEKNESNHPPSGTKNELVAMSGSSYLSQMNVYIDTTGDDVCDKLIGHTDNQGKITLINQAPSSTVCVIYSNLIKLSLRSNPSTERQLKSKVGYKFITPLTDIAIKENLNKQQLSSKLGLYESKVFFNYLQDEDSDSLKATLVARSLFYAQRTNKERALFSALSMSDKPWLKNIDIFAGKTLELDELGKIATKNIFDSSEYGKQIHSAPECAQWTLPEHMSYIPQMQTLTKATLENDIYENIKNLSSSSGMLTLLNMIPDSELEPSLKLGIKQCSWLEVRNRVHNFSMCNSAIQKKLTRLYQSDDNAIRLICQINKDSISLALVPVVINNYSPIGSDVKSEISNQFGEESNLDKYLEATLGKNINIAITEIVNVSGTEKNSDNKVNLPYIDQIKTKTFELQDGDRLKLNNYDQVGFIYISDSDLGLGNYGNIYEPVTMNDGTVIKNRFLINSTLISQSKTLKIGIDSEKKTLNPEQVLFAHEYLHGLGLGHASISPCSYLHFSNNTKPFSDYSQACSWKNIVAINKETMVKFKQNFEDYMSFNYGIKNGPMGGTAHIGQEVLPYYQYRMGLLDKSKITSVSSDQTVELHKFSPTESSKQLIHLKTENGHFWLWFNGKNNRYDWMMENSTLVADLKVSSPSTPIYGEGVTIVTVSTSGDETVIAIPYNYSLYTPGDKISLRSNQLLFKNGSYTFDNVTIEISDSSANVKKVKFTYL